MKIQPHQVRKHGYLFEVGASQCSGRTPVGWFSNVEYTRPDGTFGQGFLYWPGPSVDDCFRGIETGADRDHAALAAWRSPP